MNPKGLHIYSRMYGHILMRPLRGRISIEKLFVYKYMNLSDSFDILPHNKEM